MEHKVAMIVYSREDDYLEKEINHKDGDKYNNNLDNLEWVYHKENMEHAYATGLNQNYCENNPSAYLSNDTVREICIRLRDKDYKTYVELAEEYDCNPVVIVRIATGRTWRRIAEEVGLKFEKRNSRFTDEQVHQMCQIFVKFKNEPFDIICKEVINEMGLENNSNTRHKIQHIYYKRAHYFTRISDQYDY